MSEELVGPRSSKKARLGRGLGSLLGEHKSESFEQNVDSKPIELKEKVKTETVFVPVEPPKPEIPPGERVLKLPIEWVFPNPKQPRRFFEPNALQELSDSIKEKGILQPIVARKEAENRYEIISGERRWRASQLAGLQTVPVLLREADAQETLELALIENIQRENLNPIEEAEAYLRLVEDFGLTQQQISEKVSKERATVANTLRLLNLPKEVRELVAQGSLSSGHAKVLLALNEPVQIKKIALKVCSEKLTVRALEKMVAKVQEGKSLEVTEAQDSLEELAVKVAKSHGEDLQRLLGTKVAVNYSEGRGQIVIHYYSEEEFTDLVVRMKEAWQN